MTGALNFLASVPIVCRSCKLMSQVKFAVKRCDGLKAKFLIESALSLRLASRSCSNEHPRAFRPQASGPARQERTYRKSDVLSLWMRRSDRGTFCRHDVEADSESASIEFALVVLPHPVQ